MSAISRRDLAGVLAASKALSAQNSSDSLQPIRDLFSSDKPSTWVFTGDSITHGALHTLGGRSYVEHFAERLRWEMRRPRDIVINTGISGNRVPMLVSDIDWRVLRFKPTVVSLMFAMNDCVAGKDGRTAFRSSFSECLRIIKESGSLPLVHTPNTIHFPADPSRSDLPAYVQVIREVCHAQNIGLIDHHEHWSTTRKKPYELLVLLGDGAIHPNAYGHIELFHHTVRNLGILDPAANTGKFFVPR